MFIDAEGKEYETIKGRRAIVVEDFENNFEPCDIVVILQDDEVPCCVKEHNYIEGKDAYDYFDDCNDCHAMILGTELIILK